MNQRTSSLPLPPSPMRVWFQAIRPKTLTAGMGPVILGLALSHETLGGGLDITLGLVTLFSCLCLQIGTNLVNDYYDALSGVDRQRAFGPVRVTQSGLLSPQLVRRGFLLSFLMGTLLGSYLMYQGGLPIILVGLLSLITAYAYTGGPLPLSHFGLGEILALVFFGPVAVAGTHFLQTGTCPPHVLLVGIAPGALSAVIMGINNLRDRESDQLSGKQTFAVIFGERAGRLLCLIFALVAALIPLWVALGKTGNGQRYPFLLATPLLFLAFYRLWKNIYSHPIGPSFNEFLAQTGKFLFLYCLFFSLGLLLS